MSAGEKEDAFALEGLGRRLLPLARAASDFRFLVGRAPTPEFTASVLPAVSGSIAELGEDLERIVERRWP